VVIALNAWLLLCLNPFIVQFCVIRVCIVFRWEFLHVFVWLLTCIPAQNDLAYTCVGVLFNTPINQLVSKQSPFAVRTRSSAVTGLRRCMIPAFDSTTCSDTPESRRTVCLDRVLQRHRFEGRARRLQLSRRRRSDSVR